MAVALRFRRVARVFENRNYRIYTTGFGISLVGTWMQRISVGWLTWELTESGTWLGLMAFASLFPATLIGPLAGVVADRWDRLRVIRLSQSLAMVQSFALFGLTLAGVMTPWLLLALTLFYGLVAGFNQPSRLALVPSLVRPEDVGTAVAINSVIFNCARFVGPAIAGVVILASGVPAAFAANALSFVAFLIALSRLNLDPVAPPSAERRSFVGDLHDGIKYIATHDGIAVLLCLLAATSLCARPVAELLPGFAAGVFGGDAGTLALLTSAMGIGAVLGGLWMAQREGGDTTPIVLFSAIAISLSLFTFVAYDSLWLAVPAMTMVGTALVLNGIGTQTRLQLSTSARMRGRVLSVYNLIFRGSPALGALILGALSEVIGLRTAMLLGAALTGAVGLWAMWRTRQHVAAKQS
ncbi:MAG: MFS transporter [Alphaproteobacteria bacterium]|nr:MFS transporter [Alphaproteobacteria bacterium]